MNLTTTGGIIAAVVVVAVILQVTDRKSRGSPVDLGLASKIATFSGLVTGGVLFAVQADGLPAAVEAVTETATDMFVGQPTF